MTTHTHLETLANKLNDLDLSTDEENALAMLIIGRGQEAEVAGFGQGPQATIRGFNIGMPPGKDWSTSGWSTSGDADQQPTEEVAFYYLR